MCIRDSPYGRYPVMEVKKPTGGKQGFVIVTVLIFGDYRTDGFQLSKKWNSFKATAIVCLLYTSYYTANGADNEFTKSQFRLFLTKQISENTYFYAQYHTGSDSAGNSDGPVSYTHLDVYKRQPLVVPLLSGADHPVL